MNFLGSLVVSLLVLFTFIYGVRYFSANPISNAPIVRFNEAQVAEFITNRQPKPEIGPYVIRAEIIGEADYQLDLEIDYVVEPNDPVQYYMSISVGGGNDIKKSRVLINSSSSGKFRTSLIFDPASKLMARFSSSYIYVEIIAYLSATERARVYQRRIAYYKKWVRKHEPIGSFLNPSTFHTRGFGP